MIRTIFGRMRVVHISRRPVGHALQREKGGVADYHLPCYDDDQSSSRMMDELLICMRIQIAIHQAAGRLPEDRC